MAKSKNPVTRQNAADRKKVRNQRDAAAHAGDAKRALELERKHNNMREEHGVNDTEREHKARREAREHGHHHNPFHRSGSSHSAAAARGDGDEEKGHSGGGSGSSGSSGSSGGKGKWVVLGLVVIAVVLLVTIPLGLHLSGENQQDSTVSNADGSSQTWYKERRGEGGGEGVVPELERRLIAVAFQA